MIFLRKKTIKISIIIFVLFAGIIFVLPQNMVRQATTASSAPTLTSPDDITCKPGATDYSIKWIATDSNPAIYAIYVDGKKIAFGDWNSGVPIIININEPTSGYYFYTIVVADMFGNLASDTVIVTVEDIIIIIPAWIAALMVIAMIEFVKRQNRSH